MSGFGDSNDRVGEPIEMINLMSIQEKLDGKVGLEIRDIFLGIELTVLGKERLKENLEGQKGQYSGY